MKKLLFFLAILFSTSFAQDNIIIMSYNLLNYPGSDSTTRNPYFRTIITAVNPDILVVQEITSQTAVNDFLTNVMNTASSGYLSGTFIDGYDSDNAVYYKNSKFSFNSNTALTTALRDINEFKLTHILTEEIIYIYSVHLKASSGTDNEDKRAAEVDVLRARTNNLPINTNYIVVGDFNFYASDEPAYIGLLDQTASGYFLDNISMSGTWNNAAYAEFHTQSTRTTQFGGGATGGLDDRFDLLLYSPAVSSAGGIEYVDGSITSYGNDGNHYNLAINVQPNTAVSSTVADALHGASDHLPILANFTIGDLVPVELVSFEAVMINDLKVLLKWKTATEVNNYGFEIQRKGQRETNWRKIGFLNGNGMSNHPNFYSFIDKNINSNHLSYRLKQINTDGTFDYSEIVEIDALLKKDIVLYQNFPEPFNNSTTIKFGISNNSQVEISIYSLTGERILTLFNEYLLEGIYEKNYVFDSLASGVYLLKVQTQLGFRTIKMVLLK